MTSSPASPTPSLATRVLGDRSTTIAALTALTILSWLYLWHLSRQTTIVDGLVVCLAPVATSIEGFGLALVMWSVMMIAMMGPSAIPMLLTFDTVNRGRRAGGQPHVATAVFAAGYLLAWVLFAVVATVVQGVLEQAAMMTPALQASSRIFGGTLMVAAGLFQFAHVKNACLDKCRSPVDFVLNNWQEGRGGALRMGLKHGVFCVGCCWMIMLLMFVGGVMNLLWAAAITGFVLAEKLLPPRIRIARVGGSMMMVFGVYLLVHA